jgi:putative DNA primase/helicase
MIFRDTAPLYWAKGLPAIPLRQGDKMPAIDGWTFYCDRMPTETERDYWLSAYGSGNIGLPLGAQSNLVMMDIDTDDSDLQRAIVDALKPFVSPWCRVGRKGMALAFKQPVGSIVRTFQIKHAGGGVIVEGLSKGRQLVLPPSIHPTTQRPYTADCNLFEVIDELPHLPADTETILRQMLQDKNIELSHSGWTRVTDFIAPGARDNQMTKVAGLWAQGVTRGELTLLEAVNRMHIWNETCVEKVAGDELDIRKGVQNLVGFLTRDVMERKKTLPQGWDAGMDEKMKEGLGLIFSHDHEEWTYDQIINYLATEFEKHGPHSSGRLATVTFILERLGRSKSLDGIAQQEVLGWIKDSSGGRLTMAVLKKRQQELSQGEIKGLDHTEIAKALLAEVTHYGELRFDLSKFWQWGGSHWEEKNPEDLLRVVAEKYGSMQAAKRRSDHKGIIAVLATLCRKELRTSKMSGVNFANGYLTETLKLHAHDPDHGCTYTLPFRYLPDQAGLATKWEAFVDRLWNGDEDIREKRMALQEAMAVTLFGVGPRYQRAILLFGLSHTGKSQILKVVEALVPENARSSVPPNDWGDKFLPAQLAGKLLNIAGELSEHKNIDGQKFKQIISADTNMTGQHKNGQPFEFMPTATHWFASNHLPKSQDTTDGFNRRWLTLTFLSRITKEEKVPDIGNLLVADEREQIVAWAVQGMARMLQNTGYTYPPSHEELMKEVAQQNSSVRFFIERSGMVQIAPVDGSKTSPLIFESQLYDVYCNYCLVGAGVRRVTLPKFSLEMWELSKEEMGFKKVAAQKANGEKAAAYENLTLARGNRAA